MTKILIIEDEADIRAAVMDWLTFEGYHVIEAENGRVGIEAIYHHMPDLIVCDIAMPELDGHAVLIEVRSNTNLSHIPFIFLTASADRDSFRKGMNMGADDYLTKPFTHAEVLTAVRARLAKKSTQDIQIQAQLDVFNSALSQEREQRLLKSRLVAMFSHDFRNSLAAILSSSNIIRAYDDRLTPEQRENHLDRMDGSVHLLVQMIDEMMMVAEMEGGKLTCKPRPINLRAFVDTIVDEFRLIHGKIHPFNYATNGPCEANVDPKLFRQIVTNLLSNAAKYSPDGNAVEVSLSDHRDYIQLTVEDHGIGIPAEDIPRLFEPFQRASNVGDYKGTGLGLAIVKQAVDLHDGSVNLSSELGQGTRIEIALPRYRS